MPLPKELKSALDAWKAGTGEFPDSLDHGVFFASEGAFLAEVSKKAKGRESAARDAALADFLARSGLTDAAEIDTLRDTLEKSGVLKTETERAKGDLTKAQQAIKDSQKEAETLKAANAELSGRIKGIAKRDAISKYSSRVVDAEALSMFVAPHLEVADDGAVSIKGGDGKKTLDQLIDETLKAKPYLKNPEFKEGAGTKPIADPKTVALPYTPPTKDGDKPLTHAQMMMNQLVADGVIANPNAGTAQQ